MESFESWFNRTTTEQANRHNSPAEVREVEPGCDVCGGFGYAYLMVCYGGHPVERWTECPDCDNHKKHGPEEAYELASASGWLPWP